MIKDGTPILYGRYNLTEESVKELKEKLSSIGVEMGDIKPHVTVVYTDQVDQDFSDIEVPETIKFTLDEVKVLGKNEDTVVLSGKSDLLKATWKHFLDLGATWSYPDYHPHVSILYDIGNEKAMEVANLIKDKGFSIDIKLSNWELSLTKHGNKTKADGSVDEVSESKADKLLRIIRNGR